MLGSFLPIAAFAAFLPLAMSAFPAQAQALPKVEVVETNPPAGANLSRDQALYLHLRYSSDVPIRVQVKGYLQGQEMRGGVRWNPSPAYPAGTGEAIAWISYDEPTHIDELRLEVSDAGWKELMAVKVPQPAAWTAIQAPEPKRAAWVDRLSDAQQRGMQAAMPEGEDSMLGGFIASYGLLSVPLYMVLQVLFGLRWSGLWRAAALLPLIVMAPATAYALFALVAGSNIWPLVLIFTAPFGFLYLCAAGAIRFGATALR